MQRLGSRCGSHCKQSPADRYGTTAVGKLENSPPKDQLASRSQSGSLNRGRIRSSGSVRSCTVGSRRVKRVASRRGKRVANRPCNCARTLNCGSDRGSSYSTGSCWLVGLSGGCFPAFRQRFISGLSAGREALFVSWLPTSGTMPVCLCKPFSCKACPGI